jgi:hypothetical protein
LQQIRFKQVVLSEFNGVENIESQSIQLKSHECNNHTTII